MERLRKSFRNGFSKKTAKKSEYGLAAFGSLIVTVAGLLLLAASGKWAPMLFGDSKFRIVQQDLGGL